MNDLSVIKDGIVLPVEVLEPVKKGIRKYRSFEELRELISKVEGSKKKITLLTLYYTGLRVTEVNQIRKRDIDFQNNMMTVRHLKSRKFFERVIPIHSTLKEILQVYSMTLNSDEFLFPMSRQYIYRLCSELMGISPHQFRHSFAVNYLRQGGRIEDLRILLGHSYINTTMEYLKIVPQDLSKELQKIKF